jgi:hypothetical protein
MEKKIKTIKINIKVSKHHYYSYQNKILSQKNIRANIHHGKKNQNDQNKYQSIKTSLLFISK